MAADVRTVTRIRAAVPIAAGIAAAVAVCGWYALGSGIGADYAWDAGPSIRALASGDAGAFFATQPLLGSFSLILRAPLVVLAGADDLLAYRLGAFACLMGAGILAVWLERRMAARGQPLAARLAAAGICLVNPVTADALAFGHPEEPLAAALAVGAVMAAGTRRPVVAGLLLGLALATKQWALLAVLPALLAAGEGRLRLLATAVAVAAALTLPTAIVNLESVAGSTRSVAGLNPGSGERVTALNVWWLAAEPRELRVPDGVATTTVTKYSLPTGFVGATHALIVLLALPLSLLLWRRREALRPHDAIGLLALLFLLRCALDPWDNQYYHAPLLMALAAWEGLGRRGLPLVTLATGAAMWLSFDLLAPANGYGATNAMYLAWVVPLGLYLGASLYAPATVRAFGKLLRISGPVSVTTTRSSIRTPKAPLT